MTLLKKPFLILLILLTPCLSIAKEPIREVEGFVAKVSDGDTFQLQSYDGTKMIIRLYGIDAPEVQRGEKPGQPYGVEATKALQAKVGGREVRAVIMDIDKYKRLVSIVAIGDREINREMVNEGWAWAYRKYLDGPYASQYLTLEELARSRKLGLWEQNNPTPPWAFRKLPLKDEGHLR